MKSVKMLVLDVDGTMTDGSIYISENGEVMKKFNVKDGLGIKMLHENNIIPVIMTGRKSKIVNQRAKELSIVYVYQGVENKIELLKEIVSNHKLNLDQIAYIGDDINDLQCLKAVKYSACPSDAANSLIQNVKYVCKNKGGEGAVREFIEYLLK